MADLWKRFVRPGLDQVSRNLNSITRPRKPSGLLLWKRVTFLVATPAVALCMINAFATKGEAQPRAPFIKYEHLRRRNKRFPWGDGEHSLFHNRSVNALPEGYEK